MSSTQQPGPEFDHLDASLSSSVVRDIYTDMREHCPVRRSHLHGGFSFLSRYEDVKGALGDPATFSSADGIMIPGSGMAKVPPLEFDEPEHARWRKIMSPPLGVRAVRSFEPVIEEAVSLLIDQFAPRGEADLVAELAEPLPAIVIGRLVGLDQRQALEMRRIASALFASIAGPDFPDLMAEFVAFTDARLAERRAEPRNDFLTDLSRNEIEGLPIDDEAVAGLLAAYFIGGHHSTSSGIAGLLRHVLTRPEVRESINQAEAALNPVIEESLRLTTPLQLFARTTKHPVRLRDTDIAEGERVMLNLAAANRDPREFDDPENFDITRLRNPHLAFGAGVHVCPGQHLARAEMRLAVRALLSRLPDVRVGEEIVESGLQGGMLMIVQSLPISFTPC
ncbi:cytochrome P450 (plasmid) [Mycolicibacterium psychrotolerans]|uniref:cytochrome P450 n=1 Tax=Mycolicibacterium psychrotolerans TaxID=216929 RepID=UPI003D670FE2